MGFPRRHSREGGNPFLTLEQALIWVPSPAGPALRRRSPAFGLASAAGFGMIEKFAASCGEKAGRRYEIQSEVRHRVLDLAPPELKKLTGKLENFHELDFAGFREQVKKPSTRRSPSRSAGTGRGTSPGRARRSAASQARSRRPSARSTPSSTNCSISRPMKSRCWRLPSPAEYQPPAAAAALYRTRLRYPRERRYAVTRNPVE